MFDHLIRLQKHFLVTFIGLFSAFFGVNLIHILLSKQSGLFTLLAAVGCLPAVSFCFKLNYKLLLL